MKRRLIPTTSALLSPLVLLSLACSDRPQERATVRAVALAPTVAAAAPVTLAPVSVAPVTAAPQQSVAEAVREALTPDVLETVTGPASYYADTFEGRRTASGIRFRQREMFAAHRKYPFGTVLRVTNLSNDRSVTVRVVDRGPFARPKRAQRPVLDVSRSAAERLGFVRAGKTNVRIEVLEWGKGARRG